jgi:hypothetical protein
MAGQVAIEFAETGEAARINYGIPMPGSHTGRRVVALDLGLPDDAFLAAAVSTGRRLSQELGAVKDGDRFRVDRERVLRYLREHPEIAGSRAHLRPTDPRPRSAPQAMRHRMAISPNIPDPDVPDEPDPSDPPEPTVTAFVTALEAGFLLMPTMTWAGSSTVVPQPLDPDPEPTFFLVERYGISSFLGDYGMGRTVKTFTLLPGESTTISMRTWQSSTESIKESSSIIDSHEQSARERFADTVQHETTDRQTAAKTEKWHAEAEVSASWGFGSAKVSGGASGEYQSGREQFARQASEATRDHAAEASSKRELSVTSSSEKTVTSGSEALVERTITNVNVRRVLNFVFRELNQTYITKLHLKEVRVGFTNGRSGSWREVPLSGLRQILEETLKAEHRDTVAQRILKAAGIVFDSTDQAVNCLELVTIDPDGTGITATAAATDPTDGEFPPPTERTYYRFRRGPLDQAASDNPVDGVVLSEQQITMRTDSVIVEALLGQADALDDYAMEIQAAAATARTLDNRRHALLLDTLAAVADPKERAELAAKLFAPPHDDQG